MVFEPPCTERYARWCERSVGKLITYLLLDYNALRMLQKDITARENMMLTGSKAAKICPEKSKRC